MQQQSEDKGTKLMLPGAGMSYIHQSQLSAGMFDNTLVPKGGWKEFWSMRLRLIPGSSRLPRGFGKMPISI